MIGRKSSRKTKTEQGAEARYPQAPTARRRDREQRKPKLGAVEAFGEVGNWAELPGRHSPLEGKVSPDTRRLPLSGEARRPRPPNLHAWVGQSVGKKGMLPRALLKLSRESSVRTKLRSIPKAEDSLLRPSLTGDGSRRSRKKLAREKGSWLPRFDSS